MAPLLANPVQSVSSELSAQKPMNVLMLHNSYQFRGGEDESFESEVRMLCDAGHFVDTIHLKNDEVEQIGSFNVALQSIWSQPSYDLVDRKLSARQFDVLHVQHL